MQVDVLLAVKTLATAKTRLVGAADGGAGAPEAHARLALALARDTVVAVAAARTVRRTLVICSDPRVCAALAADGTRATTIPDEPAAGLNAALRRGERWLRAADPAVPVAALPADLPALRADELDRALRLALTTGQRVFCADRAGSGTTLLLAPPWRELRPRFGAGSAAAHRATGAVPLPGSFPGLRCDVDTAADLAVAHGLGLGRFTRAALLTEQRHRWKATKFTQQ